MILYICTNMILYPTLTFILVDILRCVKNLAIPINGQIAYYVMKCQQHFQYSKTLNLYNTVEINTQKKRCNALPVVIHDHPLKLTIINGKIYQFNILCSILCLYFYRRSNPPFTSACFTSLILMNTCMYFLLLKNDIWLMGFYMYVCGRRDYTDD